MTSTLLPGFFFYASLLREREEREPGNKVAMTSGYLYCSVCKKTLAFVTVHHPIVAFSLPVA